MKQLYRERYNKKVTKKDRKETVDVTNKWCDEDKELASGMGEEQRNIN